MEVYIRCEKCKEAITISDGYNNEGKINLKIIGECAIEISCTNCGNELTVIHGTIF